MIQDMFLFTLEQLFLVMLLVAEYYTPVTYQWTFTDSFTVTDASVNHQCDQLGHATVTCTASNLISRMSNQTQSLIADCKYHSRTLWHHVGV